MNLKNVNSYILIMWLIISTSGQNCDDIILCSNIFDEVCGIAKLKDRTLVKLIFQNVCHMKKIECEEESFVEVYQVDNELCDLQRKIARPGGDENKYQGRRVNDFSVVGAHQVCNHSCPTFCTDIYEPACAQIWKRNMMSGTYRTMINHCHIDLFSCTTGVNVTIHPLGKCYRNPSGLLFMQNIAAMKSLGFFDKEHFSRRIASEAVSDGDSDSSLKNYLREIVRRIFDKFGISLDQDDSK